MLKLYKHKVFVNRKEINTDIKERLLNYDKHRIRTTNEKIWLKDRIEELDNGKVLVWIYRDEQLFEENGEYKIVMNNKAVPLDLESLENDYTRTLNYFYIFDFKTSEVITTNTTTEPSTINKGILKSLLSADVDIRTETDLEEQIKKTKLKCITIYPKINEQKTLFEDPSVIEKHFITPARYYGGDVVLSMKVKLSDNASFVKNFFDNKIFNTFEATDTRYYIDAIDENDEDIRFEKGIMKKVIVVDEDFQSKKGNDIYNIIKSTIGE